MTPEQTKNRIAMIENLIEVKRIEIAGKLFSPQFIGFPLRTSKALLALTGELVSLASKKQDELTGQWGDK